MIGRATAWFTAVAGLEKPAGTLRRTLFWGTSGTFALNIGSVVWGFAVVVVLTRVLGADAYGAYAYGFAWAAILAVPAGLGAPTLVVREVATYRVRDEPGRARGIARWALRATVVASLVVVLVAGAGAVLLEGDARVRDVLLVTTAVVPAIALYRLAEGLLRGFGQAVRGRIAETTVQPLVLIIALLALDASRGRVGAPAAMGLTALAAAAAAAVGLTLLVRAAPPSVRGADRREDRRAWSRSLPVLFMLNAAQTLQLQVGVVLLGLLGTVEETGVFSAALRWSAFVSFMQFVVAFPLAPAIAELRARGARQRLQRLLSTVALLTTVFSLVVAGGLFLFAGRALAVFGEGFASGGTALRVLVIGELINVGCGPVGTMLTMGARERTAAVGATISVLVNLLVGVVLIPPLGAEGAAHARAAALTIVNLHLVWRLWRQDGLYTAVIGRRLVGRVAPGGVRGRLGRSVR